MKERLTYGIFILFSIYFLADLYGKTFANPRYDLGAMLPELSLAFKVMLSCWFGKGAYQGVVGWIDRRAGRVVSIAEHARVAEWLEEREKKSRDDVEILEDEDDEIELVETSKD